MSVNNTGCGLGNELSMCCFSTRSPDCWGWIHRKIPFVPVALPLLPLGSWFPHKSWPRLPCGACATGELQIGSPNEVDVAAEYANHPDWEPEWIQGHFSVQAECANRECRSIALIAGKMKVDTALDEHGH